ncbi:MAG: LolA-related protein [Nitrospira sp.]
MKLRRLKVVSILIAGVFGLIARGMADDLSETAWTLERLAALVKAQRESTIFFEETTYSSLVTRPLVTRGVLRFTPPSRLEKEVQEPYRERYVIEDDLVTVESERRNLTQTLSLDGYPGLRGFVETVRAVLNGDVKEVTRDYDWLLEGGKHRWVLRLRPREQSEGMIESIELTGTDGHLQTIMIRFAGGDRSVMTLLPGRLP